MKDSRYSSTLGFAGVLAGSLLVAIDAVALAPSLPVISNAFQADSTKTYWAGVSYTLGCAAFMPLFPAASAACGRRPVTLAAQILFLIGTIVCGSAQTIGALLAGRTLQGVGGGGLVSMLYVIISDLFDKRWRPKALSINGLVWLVGVGCGPVIGGGFSGDVSWRWIFWIVLPINGLAIVLTAMFLVIPTSVQSYTNDDLEQEKHSAREYRRGLSWRNIDYLGALLLVCSLTSFLIPIIWGGIQFSWTSYHTLVPLILGIVGMIGWIFYEGFVPKHPILPLSILADRTVAISFVATFVTGLVQFGVVFYLPLYYQIVKGYSPLISGVALLPTTLLSAPSTMTVGIVISKTGKYKVVSLIGWAVMSLGTGLPILLDISTSVPAWIFISFPVGIGFGMVVTSMTVASTAPVKEEHTAIASGMSPYTRSIGQAIGIAVGNSMIQNLVKNKLLSSTSQVLRENADLIGRSITSSKILNMFMTNESDRHDLLRAFVEALQDFWWLLCALSLSCFVLCFFIKDHSLDPEDAARGVPSSVDFATDSVATSTVVSSHADDGKSTPGDTKVHITEQTAG